MDLQTLLDAITIGDVVSLLIAVGALWVAIKWVKPPLRAFVDFIDTWNGRTARPGIEAQPGVMEQISNLRADTTALREDTTELRADTTELRKDVEIAKTLAHDAAESASDAAFHSKPNHGSSSFDDLMKAVRESRDDRQAIHADVDRILQHLDLTPKGDQ